jgi:predicted dehydrogenase
MYVLGKQWQDGYLDATPGTGSLRIQVALWLTAGPVSGAFIERPFSPRMVLQYTRDVGVRQVATKIRSRLAESLRNRKVVALGLGRIAAGSADATLPTGTPVAFVAPTAPPCAERLVLDERLVRPLDVARPEVLDDGDGLTYVEQGPSFAALDALAGWTADAGQPLDGDAVESAFEALWSWLDRRPATETRRLPLAAPTAVLERSEDPGNRTGRLDAAVFGLGNYAKTQILANLPRGIRVSCVHEIDPTQLGPVAGLDWAADTAPRLREEERYDAVFIAGYHHTHAGLAVATLERGGYAVVEKPVVTTRDELDQLLTAARAHPGRVFSCFHMRHNPLFDGAREGLGLSASDPIHYHCQVFEIPLPARHWYRWPNSRSHLVSNGCHWVDHFLHLNDFSPPARTDVWLGGNGDTHVSVELANGAVLGLHLTHEGSPRVGVRQHVELRAGGRTLTVDDGARAVLEDRLGIRARRRINKLSVYGRMYRRIGETMLAGGEGDSAASIERSAGLMLDLEDQLAGKER